MKPAPFDYTRPASVQEAIGLLARHGDEARVIAGGQSLVPMMNVRLARPAVLVDINRLSDLDYHRVEGNELCIGALARHATLRDSPVVREACPLLSDAYRHVAHGAIRNRGTLCGNLCHADPASEMPAIMLACGATLVLRDHSGSRTVPAASFFRGLYTTDIRPGELVIEVRVPVTPRHWGWSFQEVAVRKGDFALTLVAVLMEVRDRKIASSPIACAGVADRALRLPAAEALLIDNAPSADLFRTAGERAAEGIEMTEDAHADREYRRDLVRTLTRRALTEAARRAAAVS
jgi:CO/xanthine dehydrogenase FAD-binding subunit